MVSVFRARIVWALAVGALAVVGSQGCNDILGLKPGVLSDGGLGEPCDPHANCPFTYCAGVCSANLLCIGDLCRARCAADSDCPNGQRCLTSGNTTASAYGCVPQDSDCSSTCVTGNGNQRCGQDGQCRNGCTSAGDAGYQCLPDQTCGHTGPCAAGQTCACYGAPPHDTGSQWDGSTTSASDAAADAGGGAGDAAEAGLAVARLPAPRSAFAIGQYNQRVLVFGGKDSTGAPTKTVFAYDPTGNAWTQLSDMPVARYAHGAAAPQAGTGNANVIFVVGGYDANGSAIAEVDRYDAMTDSWTTSAPLPRPRGELSMVLLGATVVAAGGATQIDGGALTTVDFYSLTRGFGVADGGLSGQWQDADGGINGLRIPPLNTPRKGAASAPCATCTAVLSGQSPGVYGGAPSLSSIETLTGSGSPTWISTGAALSHGRGYAAAVVAYGVRGGDGGLVTTSGGASILVIGGSDGSGVLGSVEAYVPGGAWSQLAPMPTPRRWLGAAAVGYFVLAIGGEDANGTVLDTVEVYNAQTNTW